MMNCLRIITSLTFLLLIPPRTQVNAQSEGLFFFPGEASSRTVQVTGLIDSNVSPQIISTQQDTCLDSSLSNQCNDWKETIGCNESHMRINCKRTCGFCQTQGPLTQFSNIQAEITPRPSQPLPPLTQPESECRDNAVASICNDWKSEFSCTHLNVITYCRKSCGFCQSQGTQPLDNQPPLNQLPGNQQANILNIGNQPLTNNRVISPQSLQTQPTAAQNSGQLIISHTSGGQDSIQVHPIRPNQLPIGPTGTHQQPTSKPLSTSPPARPVTSIPAPTGGGNIAISLFDRVENRPSTTTQKPSNISPGLILPIQSPSPSGISNIPTVPGSTVPGPTVTGPTVNQEQSSVFEDIQPSTFPTTSDMLTNTETELPFQPTIPNSWKGDKSQLPYGHSPLTLAAQSEIMEEVKQHIQNGLNINHQDHYGMSALMWVAGNENIEILELLLRAGASPNLPDSSGSTALMYAAFNNNGQAVQKLLDNGADIDLQDSYGETALMNAARVAHFDTIEVLLEGNAQVDLQDNQGMTALHYAALKQCVQCVDKLIPKCPDITLKNNVEKTPLAIAKEKGNGKIITLIEGLIQPSCVHDGVTFLAGHRRVESCIELECKCGGYYEATGNADLSCLALSGVF